MGHASSATSLDMWLETAKTTKIIEEEMVSEEEGRVAEAILAENSVAKRRISTRLPCD